MADIGHRIVKAREKIGLNQAELAGRANVDATVLNRVEKRNLRDPTASFVLRIADALGQTIDELMAGRTNARPVTLLAESNVPQGLVDATAREIVTRVITLIPGGKRQRKVTGSGGKFRGAKRNARKA
jgi:transcriptional regulator with XRE-family HTH domain